MCEVLKQELLSAVIHYGNCELHVFNNKSIIENWERNTFETAVDIPQINYLTLRAILMKYGRILEENTEKSSYILSMNVRQYPGNSALLIITFGDDQQYHIAAYAKELLGLSHIAQTAVNCIVDDLSKSITSRKK